MAIVNRPATKVSKNAMKISNILVDDIRGLLTEAAGETVPSSNSKKDGLWLNLLEMDKFVRVNNLQPVTSPIFINKNAPTPDGVLSDEIFGVSQEDRRNRFAYIDLAPYHYMYPVAAIKLASYDRTLSEVLFARGRWKLTDDGQLMQDDNGDSGPEFLYKIWGKVKIKDKTTVTTKEVQHFYEKPRDELFITKFPVIPPFYRDIDVHSNSSSKSSNIINSMYSSLISYTQTMVQYTEAFSNMTRLTQARVQTILCDIYKELMIKNVKGSPSKFGMLRRALAGKNLPYTARLVITAANLNKESIDRVQTRIGYVNLPLATVCTLFFPFMIHFMRKFFDAEFIQAGKVTVMDKDGTSHFTTFSESYDENQITSMITRFINSPSSRFDLVQTPPDVDGNVYYMKVTGRWNKENTTTDRPATITDILYIVAHRVVEDKHVFITRYPLDNYNGQFPARIEISTTVDTEPAIIGDTVYNFYPIIKGDPANSFMETAQFSNTMLEAMGGDFDGDMISAKPVMSREANEEAENYINSNAYLLDIRGKLIRSMTKDFLVAQYRMTSVDNAKIEFPDINKVKPKYVI